MNRNNYIWYPFSQMKVAEEPIHIISGKGTILIDKDGNNYIDAISSWWTNIHGHAHPYIAQKIFEQHMQLEHVIFAGFTHTPALQLAQRLIDNHLPKNIKKVFYSDNGSTAVEVAIKMAVQYWHNIDEPRKKIIAFKHAYHGDTFGSMSVSDRSAFTKPFTDYLFDVEFIEPPFAGNESLCIETFTKLIEQKNIAAFIYEPLVMGAGGMLMYKAADLDNLLSLAKKENILCIADEVMTGFYRTGRFFASDYCTNKPDIVCMSKGISGGTMTLGATACAQFIYDAFYSDDKMKALYHGHSFTANPIACSAALASLDLIEQKTCTDAIYLISKKHEVFIDKLTVHSNVLNVRQHGTILAFDIQTTNTTGYFNSIRDSAYSYFISRGVLLRPLGNTIYIMPPYCITNEELDSVYKTIIDFLLTLN